MSASVMPPSASLPNSTKPETPSTLPGKSVTIEKSRPRDDAVWQLISQPRGTPAAARGAFALSAATGLLLWGSFTPLDWGPLAWIALIPLLQLVRLERPTRAMYRMIYLSGVLYWAATLQWLRLGHPAMYGALAAVSVYFAIFFPLFVGLSRVGYWKLKLPLPVVAPVVWVGLELLRGHLLTGYCWYYLGHTQYRWIELIQVSDLVGAYGVSFVVALVSAGAADLVPDAWLRRFKLSSPLEETRAIFVKDKPLLFPAVSRPILRAAICLSVLAATVGYGYYRRSQADFKAGPAVALIQGNVTSEVKHDPHDFPRILDQHERLTAEAVINHPDLVIWPETMFRWPLFETPSNVSDTEIQRAHPDLAVSTLRSLPVVPKLTTMSQMSNAGMMIGLETIEADTNAIKTYNSAAYFSPQKGYVGRYDKIHRVIFGEYVPLVDYIPILKHFTPYPEGFGLAAGNSVAVFEVKGYRFSPVICFEDTVPHLVRGLVAATSAQTEQGPKKIDFLVNLTNDGWFHGSSELDQHLITAAFRSVECRTPMVRAVNTGISAFIDGDGVIRDRAVDPETGRSKQVNTTLTRHVPLDNRSSFYVRGGDWFAASCSGFCICLMAVGVAGRWRRPRQPVG